MAGLAYTLQRTLRWTRHSYAWRSARMWQASSACTSGRTIVITFFIAGALAGAAGVLLGMLFNVVSPFIGENMLVKGLTVIILGGLGNIPRRGGRWIAAGPHRGLQRRLYFIRLSRCHRLWPDLCNPPDKANRLVLRISRSAAHDWHSSTMFCRATAISSICACSTRCLHYGVWLALSGNMFTLGTGGFMAIGAYCSVYLTMQLDVDVCGRRAGRCGAGFAVCAGARLAHPAAARRLFHACDILLTEVVRVVALNWESVTGGATGIVGIPRYTQTWQLALLVVLAIYFVYALRRSYFGRSIAAIREDDVMSRTMGVNVFAQRLSLFVASGFCCGRCRWASRRI